jgi:hypothetical protein
MTTLEFLPEVHDLQFIVTVLGELRLLRGMNVIDVPRASQRLLAFLALRGRVVKRAALAGALWPDASESHAHSSLRTALSRSQATARMALATTKLELGFAEGVTVDINHARALARRLLDPAVPPAPCDLGMTAVTALSADLLPDWYDDWVPAEAEDWRQLRLHALEALVGHLTAAGRWVKRLALPAPPYRGNHSGKAARPLLSRYSWPRATCQRLCASSQAIGHCFTTNLAWNPLRDCITSSRTCGYVTLRSRCTVTMSCDPIPAPGC